MRAKWLAIWHRLTPLWLSLWLVSSFAHSPIEWHDDGRYCEPCTIIEPVQLFDECCESETSSLDEVKASNQSLDALDCRQCCEPTSKHASTHFVAHSFAPVTLGAPFQLSRPVQSEVEVCFPTTTAHRQSLPRPPPRGRAPPFELSFA